MLFFWKNDMWKSPKNIPIDREIWVQDVNDRVCRAIIDPDDEFCYDVNGSVVIPVWWQPFVSKIPPSPKRDS